MTAALGDLHLKEYFAWCDANRAFVLQRNDCSRLHHLKDAIREHRLLGDKQGITDAEKALSNSDELKHTFVLRHDWAKAFDGADGLVDDNAFKLPYDICAFEFRVGGRGLIAIAHPRGGNIVFGVFVQCGEYWTWIGKDEEIEQHLMRMVRKQLLAACVALDAEVATHTVERAPHKLNQKRIRAGKTPLSDYHVVDLAHRHRISNPSDPSGNGSRKRLHFRRGHWRHYEVTKTWIRWCLVGDPDLGFINKHYTM